MTEEQLKIDVKRHIESLKVAKKSADKGLEIYDVIRGLASDAAYKLIKFLESKAMFMEESGQCTKAMDEEITALYKLVKDSPDDKISLPDISELPFLENS